MYDFLKHIQASFELLNLRTDYILNEVMSHMVDVQTISIVVAAVGVFIAAINSVYSSREATRQRQTEIETRQAELFMQMYRDWSAPGFRKAIQTMDERARTLISYCGQ